MKIKQTAVLASVVAGATISTTEAGFLPGMIVPVQYASPAGSFVGSAVIQTSEDGTTWATATGASAITAVGGGVIHMVTLKQFIRLNMTAFTSGNLQASILSDIA